MPSAQGELEGPGSRARLGAGGIWGRKDATPNAILRSLGKRPAVCGALLGPLLVAPESFESFHVDHEQIDVLGLVLVHIDDMTYKLTHGVLALWDLFDEHGVSEALNPLRASAVPGSDIAARD